MIKKRVLLFIGMMMLGHAAFGADEMNQWGGFVRLTYPGMPATLIRAAESVFRIAYPHGETEIFDLEKNQIDTQKLPDSTWPESLRKLQFTTCQKQNIKKCPVMREIYFATCFFFRDQQTIVTNLHVVSEWLYEVKHNNPGVNVEDLESPLVITDEDYNVRYSPFKSDLVLRLSEYNRAPYLFSRKYSNQMNPNLSRHEIDKFMLSDYVELHFNRAAKNIRPLMPAKDFDRVSDLYLIGYPLKIEEGYVPRGDEGHLLISSDHLFDPGHMRDADRDHFRFVTFNTASPGSSGSPLVNIHGEVLGVLYAQDGFESMFLQINPELRRKVWSHLASEE